MPKILTGLLDFELKRKSNQTLARQLYNQIRERILKRVLTPGYRLPSTRNLAEHLNISRNTVSSVVDQLAREGYLELRRGRRASVVQAAGSELITGKSVRPRTGGNTWRISDWAGEIRKADWPFWTGPIKPLFPGLPDPREFPHDQWARSLRRAGRCSSVAALTVNRPSMQEALVAHLREHRGVKAEPRQLIVTPSGQAAIILIARILLNPGELAWVESPGYGGAQVALALSGAKVRGIPLDEQGMSIKGQRDNPRLICVTPSHQYPTGRLMPIRRRQELLAFAAHVGATIVEDDYDSDFHYDGRPVAALQALDESGQVIYVGSFSKSMCGKARGGYVVVPEHLVDIFDKAQRYHGLVVAPSLQDAFANFIEDGHFASNIRRMTRIYRSRRDALVQQLTSVSGKALTVTSPAGGMQLLANLDQRYDDQCFVSQLAQSGVIARPLSRHYLGKATAQGLFLGFATWNEKEIEMGAEAIGKVVRKFEAGQLVRRARV